VSRGIVPIADMNRRAPEAGRIRLGVKSGRAMKSIDTFRFTSPHQSAIERIAEIHGGSPKPWSDDRARIKNQWEVITPVNTLEVILPADGLSVWYEKWGGGGCERRCDGVTVTTVQLRGDDVDEVQSPCICVAKNARECDPHTRLNIILPNVDFFGTWRLESKGWNAAAELPGMFDLIQSIAASGKMVQAELSVHTRETVTAGKKRKFIVPSLAVRATPQELASGGANSGPALARGGPAPVSHAGELGPGSYDDDEVVTATLVDDEPHTLEAELRGALAARKLDIDADRFIDCYSDMGQDRVRSMIERLTAEEITPVGFKPDGKVLWSES
jgi:hypothetical protein